MSSVFHLPSPYFQPGTALPNAKGRGKPVLYLDFDGVLHHEEVYQAPGRGVYIKEPGFTLFQWAPVLEALLEPHPEVRIVLSTTWVRIKGFDNTRAYLPPSLQQRVVGGTFHRAFHDKYEFQTMSRGLQIWADVLRRTPADWVAVDDDTFGWPAWSRDKLVATDGGTGLSDPKVQEALAQHLVRITRQPSSAD